MRTQLRNSNPNSKTVKFSYKFGKSRIYMLKRQYFRSTKHTQFEFYRDFFLGSLQHTQIPQLECESSISNHLSPLLPTPWKKSTSKSHLYSCPAKLPEQTQIPKPSEKLEKKKNETLNEKSRGEKPYLGSTIERVQPTQSCINLFLTQIHRNLIEQYPLDTYNLKATYRVPIEISR